MTVWVSGWRRGQEANSQWAPEEGGLPPEWSRKQEARIKRSGDRETINNCGLLARRSYLSHPLQGVVPLGGTANRAFLWRYLCRLSINGPQCPFPG